MEILTAIIEWIEMHKPVLSELGVEINMHQPTENQTNKSVSLQVNHGSITGMLLFWERGGGYAEIIDFSDLSDMLWDFDPSSPDEISFILNDFFTRIGIKL